jgi:hypothetical protein
MRNTSSVPFRSPVGLAIGEIDVTFTWIGDRWCHRVTCGAAGCLSSVEGPRAEESDPRWPASPAFVELSRLDLPQGPAILAVGLAGRSHFSASVSGDAARRGWVRFEIACRLVEPPVWLGSTYLGPAGQKVFLPEDGPTTPPATVQWTYAFGPSGPAEA